MPKNNLVPVVFLKKFRQYGIGEVAGFHKKLSDRLLARDIARAYKVEEPVGKKRRGRPPNRKG